MTLILAMILSQSCSECCAPDFDSTANNYVTGYAVFPKVATFQATAMEGDVPVSVYAEGVAVKRVTAPLPDQTVRIIGRKRGSDRQSAVIITNQEFVDGGILMSVNAGGQCQHVPMLTVTNEHVGFGNSVTPTCGSATDLFSGGLLDQSSLSGHRALRSSEGYYLTIGGGLSENRDAVLEDGGRPAYDAGDQYVMLNDSGLAYYTYAGGHGDTTSGSAYGPRYAGFLHDFYNPITGTRADHRAYIDWNGAYCQNHQMSYAQFPEPEARSVKTSLGTFFYGALRSSQYYAFDTNRWYYTNGTRWIQVADHDDVGALLALIAVMNARITALEAAP